MSTKDLKQLRSGEKIFHRQLGPCTVKQVRQADAAVLGIILVPDTVDGQKKVAQWTDMPGTTPFLETTFRYILYKFIS